ncbi:MAG: lipoprotein [Thiogranum sp.]|nr:lipoprotein [Thiogranum sp.]
MKPCWANYLLWLIITLAGIGAMLSACGQKGNLYLPDESESREQEQK